MKIYVGEVVKNAVKSPGQLIPTNKIAALIGVSRAHFYHLINDPEMNIEYVIKIGKAINVDFSKQIKELKDWEDDVSSLEDSEVIYSTREKLELELIDIQRKYILALEDIRGLQKELREYEKGNKN